MTMVTPEETPAVCPRSKVIQTWNRELLGVHLIPSRFWICNPILATTANLISMVTPGFEALIHIPDGQNR